MVYNYSNVIIHNLLQKNGINLTLPTLRLYLHRLRNNHKKNLNTTSNQNPDNNLNSNKISSTPVAINPNIPLIKQQNPDLELLSKAFIQRKI